MAYGDETVLLVAIAQPLCTRTYGDGLGSPTPLFGSPPASGCLAVLGDVADRKCFNTRFTCQDPNNYNPGTLTLLFGKPQEGLSQYGYVIPSLVDVETTPGAINLASMDRSASALGQREVVSLTFKDHLHSDLLVDKYRLERATGAAQSGSPSPTYDPYTRGTFWGKWLARNPYYSSYALRVYRGTMGQALEDMEVRHYLIDRIDGPNGGTVRMTAKDKFSRIEARKAVAPTASRGELTADISAVASSFSVSPAGIGNDDYPYPPGSPSEMYVAIGEEIIKCTRSSDTFTVITRGALGTTAAAHNDEDLVQWVLPYVQQLPHDIIYDLLTEYGGIATADIDQADWDEQAVEVTGLYTGYIAKPTPVNQLVGEICEQAGVTVWPDVRTGEIRLRALRARSSVATLDDDAWIIEGSLSTRHLTDRRVSQVWVYYGKKNPIEDHEDERNYYSRLVSIDTTAEDSTQYDEAKIHTIFSRWIPQFGRNSAEESGERILSIFRDPPLEAHFQVDRDRDGDIDVSDYITLDVATVVDETGAAESLQLALTSMKRGDGVNSAAAMQIAFGAADGGGDSDDRIIYLENDSYNLNLRTIHDSLYSAPPAGSPGINIRFVVLSGVIIGSTSTGSPALRTGSWSGYTFNALSIENVGKIQGKGANGGAGANFGVSSPVAGGVGGTALLVEYPISLTTSDGQIWSGGGGGGGGGGGTNGGFPPTAGGGGGGGGGGIDAGSGGAGGTGNFHGGPGNAGTATAGGSGGGGPLDAGDGGAGGAPGVAGSAGADGDFGTFPGAAGGAAGNAIDGVSLVTFVGSPTGDIRGPMI